MSKRKKPFVIAIAAVSGGGKTTVVQQLQHKLPHAKALFFDHYDFEGPPDPCEWVEQGADYDKWNLTPLLHDVKSLVADHSQPLHYLLLDYPFAYLHSDMSKLIDFTIFIDTPLDVAMARRILRDYTDSHIEHVRADLENYLLRGRPAYLEMLTRVKPNSDYLADGTLPVLELVELLLTEIKNLKDFPM